MKVGIVTFHTSINYGAVLQCYALQEYLISIGHQVEVINYTPSIPKYGWFLTTILSGWKQLMRALAFRRFTRNRLVLTRPIRSLKEIKAGEFDVVISGSDQCWNTLFYKEPDGHYNRTYFLQGLSSGIRKVAYAESIGSGSIENDPNITELKSALFDFYKISVREEDAQQQLKSIGVDSEIVADPTLLLESRDYDWMIKGKYPEGDVFSYVLTESRIVGMLASKIAIQRGVGLSVITLTDRVEKEVSDVVERDFKLNKSFAVEDWLRGIRNSSFVVTDSYHGVVFCLLYHKPFIAVLKANGDRMNLRITELLKRVGLCHRSGFSYDELASIASMEIDWTKVDERVASFRMAGKKFLERAIGVQDVDDCHEEVYFHTNILAPYRRHQFSLIARYFPSAKFCFWGKLVSEGENVWKECPDELGINWVRCAEQTYATAGKGAGKFSIPFFNILCRQKWGSVHVVGAGVRSFNRFMLLVSALVGHSKLIVWDDGCLRSQVGRVDPIRSRILRRLTVSGIWTNGSNGRRAALANGLSYKQIANQFFAPDCARIVKYIGSGAYACDRHNMREHMAIRPNDIVIVTVSRWLDWKRLVDLASALEIIDKERSDLAGKCVWILLGGGDCQEHIPVTKRFKHVRVIMHPPVAPDEVRRFYAASDIFAFPSEGDIWGLVVHEALAQGLPVVCTEEIGSSELVKTAENGFRVNTRDPREMAKKLSLLLEDSALLEKLSIAAESINTTWTINRGVVAFENLLKEIRHA